MSTGASAGKLQGSSEAAIDAARKAIEMFGNNAEHNIDYFLNNEEKGTKNAIISFKEGIILANFETKNNVWNIFPSGILSQEEDKIKLFEEFCGYCLIKQNANEVYAELSIEMYNHIRKNFDGFRISEIQSEYSWPIVDLEDLNQNLEGNSYYELRKIKNSFSKNNGLKIEDVDSINSKNLKQILSDWKSNRRSQDQAHSTEYKNWVKTNFKGCDYAKCWLVNDKPSAIVAGWKIPNSNSFYLAVVLHNYKVKVVGEMLYLQTLLELKRLGYSSCNLGGSDENLLKFKKKFLPTEFYKTVEFSVRKK